MDELMKALALAVMEQMKPEIERMIDERVTAATDLSIKDSEDEIECIIERWVEMNPEKFSASESDVRDVLEDVLQTGTFTVEFQS